MQIEFSGEAYESFQRLISLLTNYTVRVTVNLDDETYPGDELARFDATLLGPDFASEWGDAVRVRRFNEETAEAEGEPFTVRAEKILVY